VTDPVEVSPGFAERFWSRVDRRDSPAACWPWTAGRFSGLTGRKTTRPWHKRYGQVKWLGYPTGAHRVALLLTVGPPPAPRMLAIHSCDNPPCCNPAHLRWGTFQDNAREAYERSGMRPTQITKLTERQVAEVKATEHRYGTQAAFARRFGVSLATINDIVAGRTWRTKESVAK
jgi:hypothetical protein